MFEFRMALAVALMATSAQAWITEAADGARPAAEALYIELHQNPELPRMEVKTSARLAKRLKELGFTVTTGVGKTGVVGVLKNGEGPTVLLRTELDGLPVEEATGLPFASKVKGVDHRGNKVPVMHACGHDMHMAAWSGAAEVLVKNKQRWKGTLVMIGQPEEELGGGARSMLEDGLFKRFPKPDIALALHMDDELPAGQVASMPGPLFANVDTFEVIFNSRGGHGAAPHLTVDPILMASRFVLGLQTVISRQRDPLRPGVISVGSFHAGTKENIIPQEAKLLMTVRSYDEPTREILVRGIEQQAKAEAMAAGAPPPTVRRLEAPLNAVINDHELTPKYLAALGRVLGEKAIAKGQQTMGGEDFGEYVRAGARGVFVWVGAQPQKVMEEHRSKGAPLPTAHSPNFAPDREIGLRTAVVTLTTMAIEAFNTPMGTN